MATMESVSEFSAPVSSVFVTPKRSRIKWGTVARHVVLVIFALIILLPAPVQAAMLLYVAGFMMALPVVLYQVWAFVAPGLYTHEKKLVMPLVIASTVLFLVGVTTAGLQVLHPQVTAAAVGVFPDLNGGGLRQRAALKTGGRQPHQGCGTKPLTSLHGVRPHLTVMRPIMPASKWPAIRQANSNVPARLKVQTMAPFWPGSTCAM